MEATMHFLLHSPYLFSMSFQAIIPFKPVNPKTRLSCLLNQEEREIFARAMLKDVVSAVQRAGGEVSLLCTTPFTYPGARTVVSDLGLNEALNSFLAEADSPLLIIMADLPLVTPEAVRRITSTAADCAIAPGRGGGTNAIFLRHPGTFLVDFYGASFLDHMRIARSLSLETEVVDSFRLHTDIDEKEDLVEILLHAEGESRNFLERSGFSLLVEKGRVSVQRDAHKQAF